MVLHKVWSFQAGPEHLEGSKLDLLCSPLTNTRMLLRQFWKFQFLILVVASFSPFTWADVIFDNGSPDSRNGSEMTHWFEADDFVLTQTTRLESLKFWNFEIDGYFAGFITWRICSVAADGGPGQILYSGTSAHLTHSATGMAAFGAFKEYVNTFDILPVTLPPGTYWLALHNGDVANSSSKNFFWEASKSSAGTSSYANETPFTGPWRSNAYPGLPPDLAYQINGAPLPQVTSFAAKQSSASITFSSLVGRSYRVDYKNNLTEASWTPLPGADNIRGTGDLLQVTDSSATQGRRFYRVGFSYSSYGRPEIVSFTQSDLGPRIVFRAAAGASYRVEYKNEMTDSSWSAVSGGDFITGTGDLVEVVDSAAPTGEEVHRFYRVTLY